MSEATQTVTPLKPAEALRAAKAEIEKVVPIKRNRIWPHGVRRNHHDADLDPSVTRADLEDPEKLARILSHADGLVNAGDVIFAMSPTLWVEVLVRRSEHGVRTVGAVLRIVELGPIADRAPGALPEGYEAVFDEVSRRYWIVRQKDGHRMGGRQFDDMAEMQQYLHRHPAITGR